MKQLYKSIIYSVVVAAVLFCSSESILAQQQFDTKISRDSILVGERVLLNTRFSAKEGTPVVLVPYSQTLAAADTVSREGADTSLARLSQMEVLRELTLDTLQIKKGIAELEAKVLLTSFDTGVFKLPEPQIIIGGENQEDPAQLMFEKQLLTVSTVQVDTTGFVMADIKGQITYPVTFKEVLPWLLLALLIVVIAFLVYRYIKYRKDNRSFFGKAKVQDPPHIIALRELEHIRNEKLWQAGKEKQYYTGITDTLRDYIERRFGLSTKEKTSTEILEEIKDADLDKKSYEELSELFSVSDLVKFAKYTPSIGENEEAVPVAVRFVNSTFMQQMNEEKADNENETPEKDGGVVNDLNEKGE